MPVKETLGCKIETSRPQVSDGAFLISSEDVSDKKNDVDSIPISIYGMFPVALP